jgi:hypothetical protein
MSRRKKRPEPFYRRFDGWWYVQIGKRQIKLAKGQENEDEAWRAYYRVMAKQGPATPVAPLRDPTVTAVCNLFLDFSQKAHAPRTYEFYRDFLEDFGRFAGKLRLSDLGSTHVATWLDRHPDWKGCRRGAVTAVKRAFNYAYTEGKIDSNPLRTVKKPPPRAASASSPARNGSRFSTTTPWATASAISSSPWNRRAAGPARCPPSPPSTSRSGRGSGSSTRTRPNMPPVGRGS